MGEQLSPKEQSIETSGVLHITSGELIKPGDQHQFCFVKVDGKTHSIFNLTVGHWYKIYYNEPGSIGLMLETSQANEPGVISNIMGVSAVLGNDGTFQRGILEVDDPTRPDKKVSIIFKGSIPVTLTDSDSLTPLTSIINLVKLQILYLLYKPKH